jgi:hypothetical protein
MEDEQIVVDEQPAMTFYQLIGDCRSGYKLLARYEDGTETESDITSVVTPDGDIELGAI